MNRRLSNQRRQPSSVAAAAAPRGEAPPVVGRGARVLGAFCLAVLLAWSRLNADQSPGGVSTNSPSPAQPSDPPPAANAGATNAPTPSDPSDGVAALLPGTEPLKSSNLLDAAARLEAERVRTLRDQLALGRNLRRAGDREQARQVLTALMTAQAPEEVQRGALLELALLSLDAKEYVRAQHLFAQYLTLYPRDAAVPEVLLRQGLLYRQMGANTLAISKFYAVMSSALNLKLDQFAYYQRLVLQAQTEIADTYYLQGRFAEAADFFRRVLKQQHPDLNRAQIAYKLVRSLAAMADPAETVAEAERYLAEFPGTAEEPEVRFLLASALKQMGRNHEAMQQVLALLESQKQQAAQHPEAWVYWQRRAGNEIANQLYHEGDYLNALEIYTHLAALDPSASWQLPVWYQIGLVYERLKQPRQAVDYYTRLLERQPELVAEQANASLLALVEMARWRKDYLTWLEQAETRIQAFRQGDLSSGPQPPKTAVP
jgi:tetratricopeptide (TPR) repeat protein